MGLTKLPPRGKKNCKKFFKISLLKNTANIQFDSHTSDLVKRHFRHINTHKILIWSKNYKQKKQNYPVFFTSKWNCL